MTWMDSENNMLSKINQMEKVKNHMTSLITWDLKQKATKEETRPKKHLTDTDNSPGATRGKEGWGEVEEDKGSQIYGGERRLHLGW